MGRFTIYISAENPHYSHLPLRQNNALMYELLEELRRIVPDKNIRLCEFVLRQLPYSERSFRVTGMSIKDAIKLGKSYGQEAIFIEGKGLLHLTDMTINPLIRRHTGEEAWKRPMFTLVEGMRAVSHEIDYNKREKFA